MADLDDFYGDVQRGNFQPGAWRDFLEENEGIDEQAREIREFGASMEWEVIAIHDGMPTDLEDWDRVIVHGTGDDWDVSVVDSDGNLHNIDWMTTADIEDYIWADLWQWAQENDIDIEKEYEEAAG
jgi:hypothetical protein